MNIANPHRAHAFLRLSICLAITGGICLGLGGCLKQRRRGPDMAARIQEAPPIRVDDSGEVHILVMQAPNPGWSFVYDQQERTAQGVDVFITIRRPDPSLLYPMIIVEKQVSTPVQTDRPIRVMARLLAHDETTKRRRYAPINQPDS